jgi:hypothetical protein
MMRVRGSAVIKIAAIVAVIVAMGSFLAVGLAQARRRADLTHCRNNLRRLGEDVNVYLERHPTMIRKVIADWEERKGQAVKLEKRGRGFWQAVRLVLYSTKRPREGAIDYKPVPLDMFDCPVNGTGARDWDDPETIEYRAPAEDFPPAKLEEWNFKQPFAADRIGNHGPHEPGYALFLSLEVRQGRPEVSVDRVDSETAAWQAAQASTAD